jgi:hypothetical protein
VDQKWIDTYDKVLTELGAENVKSYIAKLNIAKNTLEFEDLLYEGYSAILLLTNGFSVTMQESPDLLIRLGNDIFFAEVKHFRPKDQDKIDQENMERTMQQDEPMLVEIGKTPKPACDEVFDIIVDKRNQFKESFSNIMIIKSDSPNVVDDSIRSSVMRRIRENIHDYPELARLNGILLLTSDYSITNHRDVYYSETERPLAALALEVHNRLGNIRKHRDIKEYLCTLLSSRT